MSKEKLNQLIAHWRRERQRQIDELISGNQQDRIRVIADRCDRDSQMLRRIV